MAQKTQIFLSRLEAPFAAALLAGTHQLDPTGRTAANDLDNITAAGQCFAATAPGSQAVYVVEINNGVAWISAAKGAGAADWAGLLLPVIEAQAKGCAAVAFQTKRPGLVRRAKAQGYTVAGWILKKDIQ